MEGIRGKGIAVCYRCSVPHYEGVDNGIIASSIIPQEATITMTSLQGTNRLIYSP